MPKTLPLSNRHRRSRQRNLRSLLAIEHDHVSTTRIVSDDNIINSCDENDSDDVDITKRPSNPKECLTPCFDSFSSFDNHYYNANVSKVSLSDDISFAATIITPSPSEDGYTTPTNQFVRHPLPSVSLSDLTENSSCTVKTLEMIKLASALEKQCPRSCSIESQFSHDQQDVNCSTPSVSNMSPWGQFVEMQIPEDDEVLHFANVPAEFRSPSFTPGSLDSKVKKQSFGSRCGKSKSIHDPYPRDSRSIANVQYRRRSLLHATKRIPLTFSTRFRQTQTNTQLNKSLEEFILLSPDVEDATFHLGSLSF